MAHWARINEDNIVTNVTVGNNNDSDEGYEWIIKNIGGEWIKTSFTSRGGDRIDPNTGQIVIKNNHFRYNFAGIGYLWDKDFGIDGAFIPPKPYPSWVLDVDTALWNAPFPQPVEDGPYKWNEDSISWVLIER